MAVEEERKYDVDPGWVLPELVGCLPEGARVVPHTPKELRATYYDTVDLRLARSGVSLRFRQGDEQPWTAKLPAEVPGSRHEISRPGKRGRMPDDLRSLLTVYHRGAPLAPVVVVRTVRTAADLCAATGEVLAELADDTVTVLDGRRVVRRFREIEVERKAGDRDLLDRVGSALTGAGARSGDFTPKHVRALGEAAAAAPDLPAPEGLGRKPTASAVVTNALRADVARILTHDPLVRLRAPVYRKDGRPDTAVHQMRVGTRRLRSDLRTFRPLLDRDWVAGLRDELSWLADALGAARDAEVLRAGLRRTAQADPLSPLDPAAVDRIDAELARRQEAALVALDVVLASDRYRTLVSALLAAARQPQLRPGAGQRPAGKALPKLVSKPWRALARGGSSSVPAGELDPAGPDAMWHAVRIRAKRLRYAADAAAAGLAGTKQPGGAKQAGGAKEAGGAAAGLADAVAEVQDLLGDHQDAVVAAGTWLDIAAAHPEDQAMAVTAGRLAERERATVHALRRRFPKVWRAANKRRLTRWMS